MNENLKIVFMGTPDFAVGVLKKLVEEKKNIVGVITAPDRQAGRGRKVQMSSIKEFALQHNIKILQPNNLKNKSFLSELKNLDADVQIVVAFRMLPKVVWQMPKLGTFNLHASLLPQYRGAAPINWAIINCENKTGVTTFFIDEKIDTGQIILQSETEITAFENAESLHDKLMISGAQLVLKTVNLIASGNATTKKQRLEVEIPLNKAEKLTPENTKINWNNNAEKIDAFIRGLSPYPCAWTTFIDEENNEVKMKIYEVEKLNIPAEDSKSHGIGKINISKKSLEVYLAGGIISIKELQLPGKRRMKISELLNGYSFPERLHFT